MPEADDFREARRSRASFAFARAITLSLATTALLLVPLRAQAIDVPPAPTQWLTDAAGILSSSDASALNGKLQSFEQSSGAQFLVYIFPTLGDEALEDFTIRCAEKWKAGQKKYDNGLILFVFIKERKVRIEVGYGLEGTVTDAVSSDVIRNDIAPHFQKGEYAGGLNAAADDLIARIEKKEAPVPAGGSGRGNSQSGVPPFLPLIVIILIFVFVIRPLLRKGGCGFGGCLPLFPFGGGGGGSTFGGGGWGGGGGFGGGGFSGGGGGFGGGGASGGW